MVGMLSLAGCGGKSASQEVPSSTAGTAGSGGNENVGGGVLSVGGIAGSVAGGGAAATQPQPDLALPDCCSAIKDPLEIHAFAQGFGKLLAVGTHHVGGAQVGGVFTSDNGEIWEQTARFDEQPITDVAFGNGRAVAVGRTQAAVAGSSPALLALVSSDGIAWQQVTVPEKAGSPDGPFHIAFGNNLFVASSVGELLSSPDGLTWTEMTSLSGARWLAFAGGHFAAWAGGVYTSDGASPWEITPIWQDVGEWQIDEMFFSDGEMDATRVNWCCAGEHPELNTYSTASSVDGVTWSTDDAARFVGNLHVVTRSDTTCLAWTRQPNPYVERGPSCAKLDLVPELRGFFPFAQLTHGDAYLFGGSAGIAIGHGTQPFTFATINYLP